MVKTIEKGSIVEAGSSYTADPKSKDELTFSAGDKFRLLKPGNSDESWWAVQQLNGKKKGYVPANVVHAEGSMDLHDWCHGAINRSAAEFLLVRSDQPGSFLVRESQSKPGDYTLSLYDGKVAHYRVNEHSDGSFFIRQKQTFPSIPDLIAHHMEHASGLPMPLSHIVPKAHASAIVISKKVDDQWELNRNDIKKGKMLGAGNYGEVFKATFQGMTVAVKTVKEDSMGIEEFMREAQVMKKMSHPNLVQLIGVCSTELPMYIVTEYIANGDLLTYLRRPEAKREFAKSQAMLYVCAQVSDGMQYLESKNCIHRDLACRNCLVADKLIVKIADFGMGRVVDDLYTARTGSKMPVKWSAPESLCYNAFSSASDVWSFGILLWEVVTIGGSPYPDIESKDVLNRLEEGYRMPEPSKCPPGMYDLMFSCWEMRAEDRPTFKTLHEGLEKLYDEAKGGKPAQAPKQRRESTEWRSSYEKSSGSLTTARLQELIDMTKDTYAKASTIVRYGDESTIDSQLGKLIESAQSFIKEAAPIVGSYSDVKAANKAMEACVATLNKGLKSGGGKMSLAKSKPTVEKLRNATRDMNKYLKSIKL